MVQKEVRDAFAFKFDETFVNRNEVDKVNEVRGFQRVHFKWIDADNINDVVEFIVHIL